MQATRVDASLKRAQLAKNVLSKQLTSQLKAGDYGAMARDAIQRRKAYLATIDELKKMIDDARDYYTQNPPYTLVYDAPQMEKINYASETYTVTIKAAFAMNRNILDDYNMIKDTKDALYAEPSRKEWLPGRDKDWWPEPLDIFRDAQFSVQLTLTGGEGNSIASSTQTFRVESMNGYYRDTIDTVEEYTFSENVAAGADTSAIGVFFDDVVADGKRVNIGILPKDVYVNAVILPALLPRDSGISDVHIVDLGGMDYNTLSKLFEYPPLSVLVKDKYPMTDKDGIVLTNAERDMLSRSRITASSFYVTKNATPFPRLKSEFLSDPLRYLDLEYKTLGDESFVVVTRAQIDLLKAVLNVSVISNGEDTYRFINPSDTDEQYALHVYDYAKLFDMIKNSAPLVKQIDGTNQRKTDDGETYYFEAHSVPALYDYMSYYKSSGIKSGSTIVINDDFPSIVLPYYFPKGSDTATVAKNKQRRLEATQRQETVAKMAKQLGFECDFSSSSNVFHTIFGDVDNFYEVEFVAITGVTDNMWDSYAIDIPDDIDGTPVMRIGKRAFSGMKLLEHVSLPASIKRVESDAFKDCSNLVDVSVPDGADIKWIGSVFKGCKSMSETSKRALKAAGYKGKF